MEFHELDVIINDLKRKFPGANMGKLVKAALLKGSTTTNLSLEIPKHGSIKSLLFYIKMIQIMKGRRC